MKKEKISEGIFITKEIREVIDIRDKYWKKKLLRLKKEMCLSRNTCGKKKIINDIIYQCPNCEKIDGVF